MRALLLFYLCVVVSHMRGSSAQEGTDSCGVVGRCGERYNSSLPCHCNDKCDRYRNCCEDYMSQCFNLTSEESCASRCHIDLVPDAPCQCNSMCVIRGDCCRDHRLLCQKEDTDIGSDELLNLGDRLWQLDVHRLKWCRECGSNATFPEWCDLFISVQNRTNSSIREDVASRPLVCYVNEAKLMREPSYKLFIDLLDNYNPTNNELEPPHTDTELQEIDNFLNHVTQTSIMRYLARYLVSKGRLSSVNEMKELLHLIWFEHYPRSPKYNVFDSSGFEHVFVGEHKRSKVNGFHSWVRLYLLEKEGNLDYMGYNHISEPHLLEAKLTWQGKKKTRASMFIGTSPEFDMALYTLCFIAKPGRTCTVSIGGNSVYIGTYDVPNIVGLQVATAFPMVNGP